MRKKLAALAIVVAMTGLGGVALAAQGARPSFSHKSDDPTTTVASDQSDDASESEAPELSDAPDTSDSSDAAESSDDADSSDDPGTGEHPDNHGADVSAAAHDCPQPDHGACVSAVAHQGDEEGAGDDASREQSAVAGSTSKGKGKGR